MAFPQIPAGSGKHPILFVTLAANRLEASTAFYTGVFGFKAHKLSNELVTCVPTAGPALTLRANSPEALQPSVPSILVPDVDAALSRITAHGGTIERATWSVPPIGKLARFKDPSGTVFGLSSSSVLADMPRIPIPFGDAPKPAPGTVCSVEMYAEDHDITARFFGELFGWSTLVTMPQFLGFDPGAGPGGVFQSHTPGLPAVTYLYATDVAAKLTELEAAGGQRMGDPMSAPGMGTFGYFSDPSGTPMGLIGP